jgi:hypothetical protein
MLDENEWTEVVKPWSLRGQLSPDARAAEGAAGFQRMREAILSRYNRLTGFGETLPEAVMHHRVSAYGPPCGACGRPLRTPRASFCAGCGTRVDGRAG